ncbi:hypothetical protein KGE16_002931 [Listeria monocytogenes]|nr:hypothetical protein [Listeria monocytogenes]EHM3395745.1 hypothetical protein [Listeria monocytogenes]
MDHKEMAGWILGMLEAVNPMHRRSGAGITACVNNIIKECIIHFTKKKGGDII